MFTLQGNLSRSAIPLGSSSQQRPLRTLQDQSAEDLDELPFPSVTRASPTTRLTMFPLFARIFFLAVLSVCASTAHAAESRPRVDAPAQEQVAELIQKVFGNYREENTQTNI